MFMPSLQKYLTIFHDEPVQLTQLMVRKAKARSQFYGGIEPEFRFAAISINMNVRRFVILP